MTPKAVAAAERFLERRQGGTLLISGRCIAAIRVAGNNIRVTGAGPLSDGAGGSVVIAPTLTAPAISVGHVSGFTLQDIKITSRAQQTAGALVLLDATVDANLYDVQIRHVYDGVESNNAGILRIRGGGVRDFSNRAWYATGNNSVIAGGGNDYYFAQWVVDEDNNTYAPRAGFETDQNGGSITFGDGVDIIHAHNGLLVDPGLSGQFVDWIYFWQWLPRSTAVTTALPARLSTGAASASISRQPGAGSSTAARSPTAGRAPAPRTLRSSRTAARPRPGSSSPASRA